VDQMQDVRLSIVNQLVVVHQDSLVYLETGLQILSMDVFGLQLAAETQVLHVLKTTAVSETSACSNVQLTLIVLLEKGVFPRQPVPAPRLGPASKFASMMHIVWPENIAKRMFVDRDAGRIAIVLLVKFVEGVQKIASENVRMDATSAMTVLSAWSAGRACVRIPAMGSTSVAPTPSVWL